jgi:dUTP pyrophosphatase
MIREEKIKSMVDGLFSIACESDLLKMNLDSVRQIKFLKLDENAQLPKKNKATDACYDVVATSKKDYGDGRIGYGLGFALELPKGTQLDCRARSSIHKTGLVLANCIGTIDEDYRGELMAVFYHVIKSLPPYEVGDRILQIQLVNRENVNFELVESLSETERGSAGFGSSGNN